MRADMRKPTPLTIIAALAFLSVAYAQGNHPYLIDTFAGQYPLGDGGPATEALLEFPQGAVVGSDGSVYISDSGRYLIRKVDPGGTISTVADTIFARGLAMEAHGNIYAASYRVVYRITPAGDATIVAGNFRFEHSGDGGPATEAGMREANDVAVAPDGTLYIADRRSARVRRVTPDGIISTYAGTGTGGFSGDGGPATAAELNGPVGLALDAAGNLYIADAPNDRVRRVALDGTITTFAGNGVRGTPVDGVLAVDSPLRGPAGLEVDAAGNVYIADGFSAVVCRVTPAGGLNIIAGDGTWGFGGDGGPAVAAQLSDARDVSTDSQGNVYITDRENHRIRRVDASGSIETFAGRSHFGGDGGPATQAVLFSPAGVAADSQGNVYIGDTQNHRVRKVAPDGTISTIAGTGTGGTAGDDGPASAAQLRSPTTLAVDAQDQLYIGGWRTVRRIRSDGIIELFAGTGQSGDSGDSGPAREARFQRIQGLVSGPGGSLYIADGESNRVRLVAPDGFIYPFAGTGESGFSGDGGPATTAQLALPTAVASDSQGNVYIVDAGNRRVRKVDPAGTITTIAGTGERAAPDDGQLAAGSPIPNGIGATVDRDGNLLVCTYDSIFKITTSGHVYRVAGQGSSGFSGDGGLATEGRLTNARGLAAGPGGEIYIADEGN
ncbi:MAG: hypothetical protein GY953_01520, partial [bacterium]|nr:hypothetical protein [bacterium]